MSCYFDNNYTAKYSTREILTMFEILTIAPTESVLNVFEISNSSQK